MTGERLTTKEHWEEAWARTKLPVTAAPLRDTQQILARCLPPSSELALLEVGCAPGGWMAYFHKTFGYRVAGIEYAEGAAQLTRKNLQLQGIPAEVIVGDFLELALSGASYDIVFSAGFIEHFQDLQGLVAKMCSMARQYVVASVPCFCGINWVIRKVMRPGIFRTHNVIDRGLMRRVHENCGLTTLFCNYVDGLQFTPPAADGREFFEKHLRLSRAINIPFLGFNRISRTLSRWTGVFPKTVLLAGAVMYVGRVTKT